MPQPEPEILGGGGKREGRHPQLLARHREDARAGSRMRAHDDRPRGRRRIPPARARLRAAGLARGKESEHERARCSLPGDTVLRSSRVELEAAGWRAPPDSPFDGRSGRLRRLLRRIRRAAPTGLPVLITGETGTGKDLAARELHRLSGRAGPFVAVNSAALPAELVESELFGHERGAFSGALRDRRGLLREADGGTFFLDEIGELAFGLQAKLLRVLEDREVRPVGAGRTERVDVRFVFATNRDLDDDVAAGRLRQDILARIGHWRIETPPLRERPEDLLAIVERVLAAHSGRGEIAVSADFFEGLALHDWPLNVRELVAVVHKAAALLPDGGALEHAHLPAALRARMEDADAAPRPLAAALLPPTDSAPTARELETLLAHYRGRVADIARHTGRDRTQVYRWLRRYALEPAAYRARGRGAAARHLTRT